MTCLDLGFARIIATGRKIPSKLSHTDTARFIKSPRLILCVIIFQSARFHPILNCLPTSALVRLISDPPSMRIGRLAPCIIQKTVEQDVAYSHSVYPPRSVTLQTVETCANPIVFSAARVLAATCLTFRTAND